MKGYVHSLESFGTVDGPGIRFVIFLQGCPLRCQYCHNPDTWDPTKAKFTYEASELVDEVLKYKAYIKTGGVTVTGGEPLMQIDFVIELFKLLKKKKIHTALDTSGITFNSQRKAKFDELIKYTDLVLLDIKAIRPSKHIEITGSINTAIIEFARYLDANKIKMWIRHVYVPGKESDEELRELHQFIKSLKHVDKVEILPYHKMGIRKYEELNIPYPLLGVNEPSKEETARVRRIVIDGE